MILADRLGLVWTAAVAGFFLLMQLGMPLTTFLMATAIFAGIPWLLLRGVDFIVTGRIRVNV